MTLPGVGDERNYVSQLKREGKREKRVPVTVLFN